MKNNAALVIVVLALCCPTLGRADRGGKLPPQGTSIEGCPPSECDCVDGNLVANCGFETGDFTDWTLSGDQTDMEVLPGGHSGCYSAFLGPPNFGFAAQDLPTAAGEYYDLSFWLRNMNAPNGFRVFWNGAIVCGCNNCPNFPDTHFSFTRHELGPGAPVSSLADVINVNNTFIVDGVAIALKYGQTLALASNQFDTSKGSDDTVRYFQDRMRDIDLAATRGLDVVFQNYDAVLFPANRGANIGARAGYPSIVVPGGFVPNPAVPPPPLPPPPEFPPGFDAKDSPYGVTFTGPAFSEPMLIGFAYAFEQASLHRTPPDSTPPLGSR